MADRCTFCETRVDIGCRHIRAQGEPPPAISDPAVIEHGNTGKGQGNGWNFHRARKNNNSLAYWAQQRRKRRATEGA